MNTTKISLQQCQQLIKQFPCFEKLSIKLNQELASLFQKISYEPSQKIVLEDDLVDSIYLILSGEAEVSHIAHLKKKIRHVPIAVLRGGESIGLNETGFYSSTGKRTATVTALTHMVLFKLNIKDLYLFLKKLHLESSMYAATRQMLMMHLIKQALPFSTLSHERLKWLADRVEEISYKKDEIIFKQGDLGDKCYLIYVGQIEILDQNDQGGYRRLALLKPPALFGEATLITHSIRNATARAVVDTDLLCIRHEELSELLETEENVAKMFMNLTIDRSRPHRSKFINLNQRITADGQEVTILKNNENRSYFKLSSEGYFIWKQLDGKHTLQDITLNLAEKYHIFAPEMVTALISKLSTSGFISNLKIKNNIQIKGKKPFWISTMLMIRRILESRIAFGDVNQFITYTYQHGIYYLFSKLSLIILSIFIFLGFYSFTIHTEDILAFFSIKHTSLFLLFGLIPFAIFEVMIHELGHAYAVKSFDREVHYMGIGWYWFGPIAFTDTSDMWLSTRKARMIVNFAGIFVDILIASIAALLIFIISNPYLQGMLWLFSLYIYISAIRNLSPLLELDGYFILMDWLDKTKLRQSAILWLVEQFPQSLRHPRLFFLHRAELIYWLACLGFLIVISIITYVVQAFVFDVLEIQSNLYLNLILPFLVVLFSCLSMIADVRSKKED